MAMYKTTMLHNDPRTRVPEHEIYDLRSVYPRNTSSVTNDAQFAHTTEPRATAPAAARKRSHARHDGPQRGVFKAFDSQECGKTAPAGKLTWTALGRSYMRRADCGGPVQDALSRCDGVWGIRWLWEILTWKASYDWFD